jgi:hypothetical protein
MKRRLVDISHLAAPMKDSFAGLTRYVEIGHAGAPYKEAYFAGFGSVPIVTTFLPKQITPVPLPGVSPDYSRGGVTTRRIGGGLLPTGWPMPSGTRGDQWGGSHLVPENLRPDVRGSVVPEEAACIPCATNDDCPGSQWMCYPDPCRGYAGRCKPPPADQPRPSKPTCIPCKRAVDCPATRPGCGSMVPGGGADWGDDPNAPEINSGCCVVRPAGVDVELECDACETDEDCPADTAGIFWQCSDGCCVGNGTGVAVEPKPGAEQTKKPDRTFIYVTAGLLVLGMVGWYAFSKK